MRQFEKFGGFDHAVADQKFLRGLADRVLEYFAEVAPIEAGTLRDVFYRDVFHVVMLNISNSFLDVEVPDPAGIRLVFADRSCQRVDEYVEVSDQMKGRLFFVAHNVEHLVPHLFFKFAMDRIVDRLVDGQTGEL